MGEPEFLFDRIEFGSGGGNEQIKRLHCKLPGGEWEDLTPQEAAERLGVPTSHVVAGVARAIDGMAVRNA